MNIITIKTHLVLILLIFIQLALPKYSQAVDGGVGLKDCFALISRGGQDEVITRANVDLRVDRWQPEAQACYAMAYYSLGDTERAVKKLREAEETLPKAVMDEINNIVWNSIPELLAEKEYRDNYTVTGGDCMLRNLKAIEGRGFLVIGDYFNPYNSSVARHLRGRKCGADMRDCMDVDLVCPDCALREEGAVIEIRNYHITDVRVIAKGREFGRNIRYIEKVLELQRR